MGVEYGFEIVKLLIAVDVARSLVKYVIGGFSASARKVSRCSRVVFT